MDWTVWSLSPSHPKRNLAETLEEQAWASVPQTQEAATPAARWEPQETKEPKGPVPEPLEDVLVASWVPVPVLVREPLGEPSLHQEDPQVLACTTYIPVCRCEAR